MAGRTEDAKLVVALVEAFTDLFPEEQHGAAHVVVEDLNLADRHIDAVLPVVGPAYTSSFLRFLKSLPENWRSENAVFGRDD